MQRFYNAVLLWRCQANFMFASEPFAQLDAFLYGDLSNRIPVLRQQVGYDDYPPNIQLGKEMGQFRGSPQDEMAINPLEMQGAFVINKTNDDTPVRMFRIG